MVLRGAAWCCVVLRGVAWCCVVLRGAAVGWLGCIKLRLCCVQLREKIPVCRLLHTLELRMVMGWWLRMGMDGFSCAGTGQFLLAHL